MKEISKILVTLKNSVEETVAAIQEGGAGIALVVDDKRKLIGTITDGDIRRAILNKIPLTGSVGELLKGRPADYEKPTCAPVEMPHAKLLHLMETKVLRQIPLVDKQGRVVELALMSEVIEEEHYFPAVAVIMAGGRGKRLLPLTKDVPKPMLPLDSRPLLERIIAQLKKSGIQDIYISTNYKSEVITDHFKEGKDFGVGIKYVTESTPLGTAGALSLLPEIEKVLLVINGDILTQLNFRSMYDFHEAHKADMTVGVRIYEFDIPYGVIETDDVNIKNITEKPMRTCIVNAGIYILNPDVRSFIPHGKRFDMTELVEKLLKAQKKVISFPIQEYWLDVGHPHDYEQAKYDLENGKI